MIHARKLTILLMVGLLPATAVAKGGDRKAAKKHYKTGAKLFKAGKYKQALPELLEANRLDPNKTLVKNIVKTYVAMENPQRAAAYLQTVIDSKRPKKAVKWAKKKLATLTEAVEAQKKRDLEAAAKKAAAAAKAEAEAAAEKQAAAAKKKRDEEEAKKDEERAAVEAERQKQEQARRKAEADKGKILEWSLVGVGVAALAGGAFFGLQALSSQDEVDKCHSDKDDQNKLPSDRASTCNGHRDDVKRNARTADVLYITGAVAGIAGVALLLMSGDGDEGSGGDLAADGPKAYLTPFPGGVGFTARF